MDINILIAVSSQESVRESSVYREMTPTCETYPPGRTGGGDARLVWKRVPGPSRRTSGAMAVPVER